MVLNRPSSDFPCQMRELTIAAKFLSSANLWGKLLYSEDGSSANVPKEGIPTRTIFLTNRRSEIDGVATPIHSADDILI